MSVLVLNKRLLLLLLSGLKCFSSMCVCVYWAWDIGYHSNKLSQSSKLSLFNLFVKDFVWNLNGWSISHLTEHIVIRTEPQKPHPLLCLDGNGLK